MSQMIDTTICHLRRVKASEESNSASEGKRDSMFILQGQNLTLDMSRLEPFDASPKSCNHSEP